MKDERMLLLLMLVVKNDEEDLEEDEDEEDSEETSDEMSDSWILEVIPSMAMAPLASREGDRDEALDVSNVSMGVALALMKLELDVVPMNGRESESIWSLLVAVVVSDVFSAMGLMD